VLTSKVDDFRLNNTNNNSKRQKVFTEIPHEAQQELQYSKAETVIIAAVCYGNIKKKTGHRGHRKIMKFAPRKRNALT